MVVEQVANALMYFLFGELAEFPPISEIATKGDGKPSRGRGRTTAVKLWEFVSGRSLAGFKLQRHRSPVGRGHRTTGFCGAGG